MDTASPSTPSSFQSSEQNDSYRTDILLHLPGTGTSQKGTYSKIVQQASVLFRTKNHCCGSSLELNCNVTGINFERVGTQHNYVPKPCTEHYVRSSISIFLFPFNRSTIAEI